MNEQQGFTLIELVVVIVILGILAVTAAPKFINLQDDARTATLQAVKASMQSAASLVYSKSLIKGNESSAGNTTPFVNVNGTDVFVQYGYPRDNNEDARLNWQDDLLDLNTSEFTVTRANGAIIINPADVPLGSGGWPADADIANPGPTEKNCFVQYRESEVAGAGPLLIEVAPCL